MASAAKVHKRRVQRQAAPAIDHVGADLRVRPLPRSMRAGTQVRPTCMNHVERFRAIINGQAVDRLPRWEWAMWWDKTIARWHQEGLPRELTDVFEIHKYFGLDPYKQFWFSTTSPTIAAEQHHVEGTVADMDDYLRALPGLYPDHSTAIQSMQPWEIRQREG